MDNRPVFDPYLSPRTKIQIGIFYYHSAELRLSRSIIGINGDITKYRSGIEEQIGFIDISQCTGYDNAVSGCQFPIRLILIKRD